MLGDRKKLGPARCRVLVRGSCRSGKRRIWNKLGGRRRWNTVAGSWECQASAHSKPKLNRKARIHPEGRAGGKPGRPAGLSSHKGHLGALKAGGAGDPARHVATFRLPISGRFTAVGAADPAGCADVWGVPWAPQAWPLPAPTRPRRFKDGRVGVYCAGTRCSGRGAASVTRGGTWRGRVTETGRWGTGFYLIPSPNRIESMFQTLSSGILEASLLGHSSPDWVTEHPSLASCELHGPPRGTHI
ncbi:uncharacterized protein LOC128315341 [Acinonyx jubatus]|uniref:Uncharacterized protein LOC128315341 n=1 Tax=Acinonyx jubatus TaxID=32536 RepID=A0ABM3Q186_ACIJB|nr:uncharacterized protein LOC128315341 [Acinonyx jubatus]